MADLITPDLVDLDLTVRVVLARQVLGEHHTRHAGQEDHPSEGGIRAREEQDDAGDKE